MWLKSKTARTSTVENEGFNTSQLLVIPIIQQNPTQKHAPVD